MPSIVDRLLGRPTPAEQTPMRPVTTPALRVDPIGVGPANRVEASTEYVRHRQGGAVVAAAARVTPSQAKAVAQARQKWQRDAWVYRDAIGEVRYAVKYLGNAASMITMHAAEYAGDGEEPIDLDDSTLDAQLIADARAIMDELTGTRGGGHLLGPAVENFEVPGECWLLGLSQLDEQGTTWVEWSIRSMDEIEVTEAGVFLRTGERGKGDALEEGTYDLIRLWAQHPRFTQWADSPMRTLLEPCEELLLVARAVRAAARNRLAGNGILLLSNGLEDRRPDDGPDGSPAQSGGVADDLHRAMLTPIGNEGHASAVVPIAVWGEPEDLASVRHLTFDRPLDAVLVDRESRAIGRIAAGMDAPPEIITGKGDVNHWTAWNVDDDTYRMHIAPIVGVFVDSLTVGYLRAKLRDLGHARAAADRIVIATNASRLIRKPDRAQDALNAYDRNELSGDRLLEVLGFDTLDKPSREELLERLALKRGAMDGAITEALLRLGFGSLVQVSRTVNDGQVTIRTGERAQDVPLRTLPSGGEGDQQTPADDAPVENDPAVEDDDEGTPPPTISAAGAPEGPQTSTRSERLSRRLAQIDRQLRDRILTAADDALHRAVERAGNRIRSKANGDTAIRASVAGVPGNLVASVLGRELVAAALGLEETELLADSFARLRTQWDAWTVDAHEEAIDAVVALTGQPRDSAAVRRIIAELRDAFEEAAAAGWTVLEQGLNAQAVDLLYDPDPSAPDEGELPATRVRPGLVRGALAVAGGLAATSGGIGPDGMPAVPGTPLGGIAVGGRLDDYLRSAGNVVDRYEWNYGISSRHFPPHRALDGVEFSGFDDPILETSRFPGFSWVGTSFIPGDHDGCHCDYGIVWTDGVKARDVQDAVADADYEANGRRNATPGEQRIADETYPRTTR